MNPMTIRGIGKLLICTLSFVVSLLTFIVCTLFAAKFYPMKSIVPVIFLLVVRWI